MVKEFKAFVLRGNVVDLAIAVVIAFVCIAAAVFFLVVKPVNHMRGVNPADEADVEMRECPECLTSIPAAAHRCAACTTKLTPATAA